MCNETRKDELLLFELNDKKKFLKFFIVIIYSDSPVDAF